MALTRPKIAQIYTNVTALTDAITVLNAGADQANVDVGFLINRAHGLVSNAAIYYSETLDGFVTAFTSNSGGTDSNILVDSFANITAGNVYTTGLYWTGNGQPITLSGGGGTATYPDQTGNAGKFLTTNGTAVSWATVTGGTHSTGATPHASPAVGDTWYNTTNDILYHYVNDGSNSYWLDIESPIGLYDDTPAEVFIGNIRADNFFWSNGTPFSSSNYSNVDVSAFLSPYFIYANANAATQTTAFNTLSANVSAYETWANIQFGLKANTNSPTFTGNAVMANLTVANLVVQGNTTTIGTADLTIQDSIIHLHTFANLAPLTSDDGRDVGLALHYYKGGDGVAFVGWANDSGSLEYYAAGSEVGNVFTGTAYGTIKAGEFKSVNTTPSTSTTTGALVVAGGAGIGGNLNAGNVAATGYYFANGAPFVSSNYGNTDVSAYLGSYFTYANANASTQATAIDSLNSNIGAYQTYANANAASQTTAFNTLDANVGSYQLWANATFSVSSYGNSNVAAYLPGYSGNLSAGNVSASGYYFANGAPFTSSGYGNTDVAAYLPTYTGNLSAGNISVTGNIVGGGVRSSSGATPPASPTVGDTWFDTARDRLFRYVSDGTSSYWLDITGAAFSYEISSNTTVNGNLLPAANVTYNLGSEDYRWKSLYLAGNTIYLGNTTITEDSANGTVTFLPSPTTQNPNPTAIVFQSNGTINAYTTIAGNVTSNTVAPSFSNVAATSVYASSFYFANGTPFSSSTFGNTEVAAYLVGNVTVGNVKATGYYFANGTPFVSGSTGGASIPRYVTYTMSGTINGSRVGNVRYYPPTAMTISNVSASVSTMVTGTNLVFEIYKNGSSLGPTYTINTNSYRMTATSTSISLGTGDYLTINVNSGISSDLRIELQYSTS